MALFAEREYRLRLGDFDRYNRLRPACVLDIFQDIATVQADSMSLGRDDMLARGVFWVVARTKYRMLADPAPQSSVVARTWPHTPTRFSFLRDYRLTAEDGAVFAEGTSEWLLLDAHTRKLANMLDYCDASIDYVPERAFERKPRKIAQLPGSDALACTIVPTYSDVDANGHVNNARYADFAIAALDPGTEGAVGTFQIDYRQEVREGQPLNVCCQPIDGNPTMAGYAEGNTVMFACRIEPR